MIYPRKIDFCVGTIFDLPKPMKLPGPMRETGADRPNWRAPLQLHQEGSDLTESRAFLTEA